MQPLVGKVAVCVGATGGIGRAVAVCLARQGASVLAVGRSVDAGESLLSELREAHPAGAHGFFSVDCSLLKNIAAFAASGALPQEVDYLVQTQGIASIAGRTETAEGIDRKLAVHHYGRICFIKQLLPRLLKSKEAGREAVALSILSAGVHGAYHRLDDLALKHSFSIKNAADAAGFYTDLSLDALSRTEGLGGVSFQHAAPGMVATQWGSEFPAVLRIPVRILQALVAKSPESCAEAMVAGMLHEGRRNGGLHLFAPDGRDAPLNAAHSAELRAAVWAHTEQVIAEALSAGVGTE